MRLKNLDLIMSMAIAAMNVIWVLLPYHVLLVEIILAFPLVFILPGYTLTEALLYRQSLDTSKCLIFSFGLSLAMVILTGLVLNILPIGLQAKSWAVSLALLTILFSLVARLSRTGRLSQRTSAFSFRLKFHDWVLLGMATMVIIQAISYSIVGASQQPHPGFTQFWMVPPSQNAKRCAVQVGIRSFELTSVTYSVSMTMNGTEVATWRAIALAPQEKWSLLVPINPGAANTVYVEAKLYRFDKPTSVYQQVNLTITKGIEGPCLTSNEVIQPHLLNTASILSVKSAEEYGRYMYTTFGQTSVLKQ